MPIDPETDALVKSLLQRLHHLEETVGFADHASGQITSEMLTFHKRLDALARRLDAMERRLEQATTIDESAASGSPPTTEQLKQNKPPHSA